MVLNTQNVQAKKVISTIVINAIMLRVRQPIPYIIKHFASFFEITTSSKSLQSTQLGLRYGISQTSIKVRNAMKSNQKYPLEKLINVDEFTVGRKEEGKQSRSYDSKKKKTVIAVELTDDNKV